MIWNMIETLRDIFTIITSRHSLLGKLRLFVEQEEEKSDMED
jgi:hypothetical protein